MRKRRPLAAGMRRQGDTSGWMRVRAQVLAEQGLGIRARVRGALNCTKLPPV